MDASVICEKILLIVHNVLKEQENNMVVGEEDIINLPFTIDGSYFNQSAVLASIEIVTIIVEIENEFQIEISDDEMLDFRTINDLVLIVGNKLNSFTINEEEDK